MSGSIKILFHRSQFPAAVQAELSRSLRERAINHKFHYDTYKQTQKWLALHEAYSPARTDPKCMAVYDSAFETAAAECAGNSVHLVGLGCGGGQKDARLLQLLAKQRKGLRYTPIDVGAPMLLLAAGAARQFAGESTPIVCDLGLATDLNSLIDKPPTADALQLYTFFGMIPNFEPDLILPRLQQLIPGNGLLLFSANLAPGPDYRRGVERVRPLYENELTRDWLLTFLLDLGIERNDGNLVWRIEGERFLRLAAYFVFDRERTIAVNGEKFAFSSGDQMRLFFSYRYRPEQISMLLHSHDLAVEQQWITESEEEGVFLCRKEARSS